jgi:endothelin-converting enzyme/putative endopeptidase
MKIRLTVALLTLTACVRSRVSQTTEPHSASRFGPASAPLPAGVVASALDFGANPCDDFFQFACGGWLATTQIPADRTSWYLWSDIDTRNERLLNQMLQDSAKGNPPKGSAYAKQLGDFYATCVDEPGLEKAMPHLKTRLKQIEALKSTEQVATEIAAQQAEGGNPLFGFGPEQDFQDATQELPSLDQGGLGLPDRDYYLKDDEEMKKVRELYRTHLKNVLVLLGEPAASAPKKVEAVLALETELAKASMDRVTRRDPKAVYHRMDLKGLSELAPQFPWKKFFHALQAPQEGALNVTHPPFFKRAAELLSSTPVATWRTYLALQEVATLTEALPKRFQDEQFAFTSQALSGAKEDLPRWKKCVHLTDSLLGEALARPFIAQAFNDDAKEKTRQMVKDVEAAFEDNLHGLGWMDEGTKREALEKLHAVGNKVGYPDTWRNYDGLTTDRSSFFHNLLVAQRFEVAREVRKMGKPVDRTEWGMTPPTVNAYYNPSMNEIALPAGILQPPLYAPEYSAAFNYGSTGASTVGHELTHGFDDEGRHFDGKGNLRDWWSADAGQAFEARSSCVAKQFDQFVSVGTQHVNGKLTLGENVADLGGLKLGYLAFQRYLRAHPEVLTAPSRLTPNQAFFLGYAQAWCGMVRPETAAMRTQVDPHAPARDRVNGPMSNLKAFREAFQCKAGDKLAPVSACEVW